MKTKIGEIYNKPIVKGDINLVTKNEIHIDELGGGSTERYFDISKLSLETKQGVTSYTYLCKVKDVSNYIMATPYLYTAPEDNIDTRFSKICAVMLLPKYKILYSNAGDSDYLIELVIPSLLEAGAKEITKEEFFNLN